MTSNAFVAAISFFIFGLGVFLAAGVRPLLLKGVEIQPEFIRSVLTSIFSRYNSVSLVLAVSCIVVQLLSSTSLSLMAATVGLSAMLALKLPIDSVIRKREHAGQIRGFGTDGRKLDTLHRIVEGATIGVFLLALATLAISVR